MELRNHDDSVPTKSGKPYLVFWIKDGGEKLYPTQRSKGVRWFLSFYLQLKATAEFMKEKDVVLLVDEPGMSLHARAQEDVIKVFDDIKNKIQIIYTTHSPYLITLDTIYRILAVQRADEVDDKSETLVLDIHKIGAASTDTLSPVYTLMGARFCDQQSIKQKNNVLLEEISAFYYLTAFSLLINRKKEAYFLPATGTSNIPQLAYLFIGWGLDFIVVVDDEPSGRKVYNHLKRALFGDDENKAKKKLLKIKNKKGIEDLFTKEDFKKYIIEDNSTRINEENSEFLKNNNMAKGILALKFLLKVKSNEITFGGLNKQTQNNITELVNNICDLLD